MKRLFNTLLLAACMLPAAAGHFITDAGYRQRVDSVFRQRAGIIGKQFFDFKNLNATQEETEALKFLYAYMALADITDYPTSFYLEQVRGAFKARTETSWGKKVPELLFRHFVLPVRVNNEALDSSRTVFYRTLKERVRGMDMYDAILEVNHWCHEHVTYQPSDGRTSSPLATMKTATGRCGEQSTFTVAALRAVGIPARQVYTPRWAHTDDNHAWVEAWADGTWYFLGACEPEPVLNLGWFNAPASRAMLMHTRAFGDYNGPEEVMLRTSNFTEINLIDNYATTARADLSIVDSNGKPVDNARVDFKIYNYAEFCTVATKYTDAQGHTFLTSGMGDMLVWASKDGYYNYAKLSFGKDKHITIRLERQNSVHPQAEAFALDTLDIVPPPEKVKLPEVSEDMREANSRRLAYEDSIRKAYTATFLNAETAQAICPEAAELLVKSRGNKQTIMDFLNRHSDRQQRAIDLLSTLSDKDLRDITTEILEDNLNAPSDQLSPRVENEMIIAPFKQELARYFGKKNTDAFRKDPSRLVTWVKKNMRIYPDSRAIRIAQTPMGALKARMTDTRSRDIFFVDAARSLGIEARKDAVTSKVQYRMNGEWIDVDFNETVQQTTPKGTLVLDYSPTKELDNPKYYSHFTISRIVNGVTHLLNFEEGQVDMGGGTSWESTFKNGTQLDAGTYMLTTGTRLANGSVLAANRLFCITEGQTTKVDLALRHSDTEIQVIGSFDSESTFTSGDKDVSILSQTGRGYFILGLIGVGQEPTNHALHDIEKVSKALENWGRPLLLLFENEAAAAKFDAHEFAHLPSNIHFGIDRDGSIRKQIATQMKLDNAGLSPIFIIADTFNRVVFVKQGYTIGLGEQLQKVIGKL